jgi:hypothetical protein
MNGGSLGTTLADVRRQIPLSLLDVPGQLRLLEVAQPLPLVFGRRPLGLELRLAGPAGADLVVVARPRGSEAEALLSWARGTCEPGLLGALEAWRSGFGWLAWNADYLLLEFDAAVEARAVPSVYLAPMRAANEGPVEVPANAFHLDPAGVVGALAALGGARPDPAAVTQFVHVLGSLPRYAEVFTAGAMLSRDSAPAPRIVVRRLRADGIARVLESLGRPEPASRLVPLAEELSRVGARFALLLELGGSATDVVGLEVYAGRYWRDGSADGWSPVLETLVAKHLAEMERAEAALLLPRRRRAGTAAIGISHVKVNADRLGTHMAKLYVGIERTHGLSDEALGQSRRVTVGATP